MIVSLLLHTDLNTCMPRGSVVMHFQNTFLRESKLPHHLSVSLHCVHNFHKCGVLFSCTGERGTFLVIM